MRVRQAAAYRRAYRFTGLFPTLTSGCVPHPRDLPHDRGRGSATPQENFHFIEESLLNAIPDLPKAPSKNYEGRITQGAAAVLLMRLYFNASWYINIPMWEQTGALCERIINGEFGTYSLTSEWTDLWNAGNQDCPELIRSYPQSRQVGYDDFYYLFFMHYQAPERFGCG